VLKYKHTHLSRRGADIKVKAQNLKTNSLVNLNFGSNDRFEEARIEKREMQFLYQQEASFYFMDGRTFNQIEIPGKIVGSTAQFLKEGEPVEILFWQDQPLEINLPAAIIFKIKSCDPGVKGNSAANIYKPAMAENGLKLKVPLFIKPGDRVKVDSRSGEYLERVNN